MSSSSEHEKIPSVDSGGDLLSIYDYFVSGYERDRQDLLASEQRLRGRERSHRALLAHPGRQRRLHGPLASRIARHGGGPELGV